MGNKVDDVRALIEWARDRWPEAFTRTDAFQALGIRVMAFHSIAGLMDTGARRYVLDGNGKLQRDVLWRYRPYQLRLPLGDE